MIDCTNADEAKKALEQAMMLALTVHRRKKSIEQNGDNSFAKKGFSSFTKKKGKKKLAEAND